MMNKTNQMKTYKEFVTEGVDEKSKLEAKILKKIKSIYSFRNRNPSANMENKAGQKLLWAIEDLLQKYTSSYGRNGLNDFYRRNNMAPDLDAFDFFA